MNRPDIARYVAGDEAISRSFGAAWIRLWKDERKGFGYVGDDVPELSIALLLGYRHPGVGTELLNRLIELARKRRFPALSLSVSTDNRAIRLYRRLGFEIVEQSGNR